MPICTKCKIDKESPFFAKNSRRPNGLMALCRECDSAKNRNYRGRNKESVDVAERSRRRKWGKDNPEKSRAYNSLKRAALRRAVPRWGIDVVKIESEWRKANPGFSLDHIVPITPPLSVALGARPLHGREKTSFVGPLIPLVYGFHTPANWQPLTLAENASKSNRIWPCAPWDC